jgi:phosphoenolpyruvate carboxykinase (GTP)
MKIRHAELKHWVKSMAALCTPDKIVWLDGSKREKERLEKQALKTGELIKLDQKKLPGCFYHRSASNDVARTEHQTFICTTKKDDAGPTNNWMDPKEAIQKAKTIFKGSMKGRTMYVVPFTMGLPNSPFAKVGVQLTDSIYVALNMRIMTTMGERALKRLGTKGEFTKCLHSKADLREDRRMILHFPETNTIWSVGSGYGGNALLGKKCLALRIASHQGKEEGWMAEHMLIMGMEDPEGHTTYFAAAFPSACGKTNLAMLIPPEEFRHKGYRIWTVGDDIAWLRLDKDGHLRGVNPEAGMFGVAPGTNHKTNPHAMATIRKNTIYTNVLLKNDRTVWWEGSDGEPGPGTNWKGEPWQPGQMDGMDKPVYAAHPNSRFTAPLSQCPSFSKKYFDPNGVKISGIIFGARRSGLAPLVYEARSWQHGVFIGATMASERTAAQVGKIGEVRRDPMAMLPFCGYNMAHYFQHWINMGKRMSTPPRIFRVNWFRKDQNGNYLWPGFGENLRVLIWMANRCRYQVSAHHTPLGYIPYMPDMDLSGLNITEEKWNQLFEIAPKEWLEELKSQLEFFKIFGDQIPKELLDEHEFLKGRFRRILKGIVDN